MFVKIIYSMGLEIQKGDAQRPGIAAGGIFYNVQPGTNDDWKYFAEVNDLS